MMSNSGFVSWVVKKPLSYLDRFIGRFIEMLAFKHETRYVTKYTEGLFAWMGTIGSGGIIIYFIVPSWTRAWLFFTIVVPVGLIMRAKYLDDVG